MTDILEKGFYTTEGVPVPAVNELQMREVDRIAEHDFGLSVLQMMENAGRNLCLQAINMLGGLKGKVVVLAGSGGNGGGGISCARHLHNRGMDVSVFATKASEILAGPARSQLDVLLAAGLVPGDAEEAQPAIENADLVVDAVIGYSLHGAPRGVAKQYIESCRNYAKRVLSLDVPSGVNATSGETLGISIDPDVTMTLALPKTGLVNLKSKIVLADIGIPPEVYHPLGIKFPPFFDINYLIDLQIIKN